MTSRSEATLAPLVALVGAERASLPLLFRARVENTPDRVFARAGDAQLTYAQMWSLALRFARFLQEESPGERAPRVAIFLGKRPEAIAVALGTQTAGGVSVVVDPAQKGEILRSLFERSKARYLVTECEALAGFDERHLKLFGRVVVVDAARADLPAGEGVSWDEVVAAPEGKAATVDPAAPASLIFTSGTTGRPKAVLLPHNMFCRGAAHLVSAFRFRDTDVFHDWMPFSHIGGQLHVTTSCLVAGATLAQFPTFSRHRFWEEVARSGATVFTGFTNILKLLLMAPESEGDADNSLRIGLIGHIPQDIHDAFAQRFGVRLLDTYGMTECEPLTLPGLSGGQPPGASGRVAPDFDLKVVDEVGAILPHGRIGRVVVRPRVPDVMMKGYEGDAAATVAAWKDLWFHTQDQGWLDEAGFFFFAGRLKHAIRRGGENLSESLVEEAIAGHPLVADCIVVGVPDGLQGQEVKAVVALKEEQGLSRLNCTPSARASWPPTWCRDT